VAPPKKVKTSNRRWKLRYLGYLISVEHCRKCFGEPNDGESTLNYRVRTTFGLLHRSGLWGVALLRNVKVGQGSELCIALACNRTESSTRLPSQQKIDKLKELLEVNEPPQWYEYDG
jgi:hypothetical protein